MDLSDNSSLRSSYNCLNSRENFVLGAGICAAKAALVLLLYIFVLYLGLQKRRQQHSFTRASHSDIFTYHLVPFELIWLLAMLSNVTIVSTNVPEVFNIQYFFLCVSCYGENFFHVLTCLERYLAVVHPIRYMRLRNEGGVRIRNISIVCVWVLSVVCSSIAVLYSDRAIPIPYLVPFALCLVPVSFCSLSVLCALNHRRPGDRGQDQQVDQAKLRAFFTITAIMVVLWFWLGGILASHMLFTFWPVSERVRCVMLSCAYMFNLPSGLVLPLLYLHRAGQLSFRCHKTG